MKYQDLKITVNPALVRDHAVDKLRNAICTGLYPPGTRLIERELCEALGVSRTSVREALRQLQSESLIEVGQRRNIRVAIVSSDEAADLYFIRIQLETEAVRRFVELADKEAIKNLVQIRKAMSKQLHKGDIQQLCQLAGEFYETILAGCGSKVIYDVAKQLLARVQYLRFRSMSAPGRLDDGLREWDSLVEAITSGKGKLAAKLMADHLENAKQAVVATLKEEEQSLDGDESGALNA
ncbi:GntR family transcriptional regulator [Spongiibacter tropicus]|uniref:GntR family transcriptional regulator n=1 Tax=Spongiibacter tropicus TaxID=454602 RepID=UPI0003B67435|nr:GntR family transcriptional regulator [Spongiibacter tropicus]